jgi:hypothetical protein
MTPDPMADPPGEADQAAVRELVHRDADLHGGGFTFRDGEWLVWLAVARGESAEGRPAEFRGYRIAWEATGPFHAEATGGTE